MSQLIPLDQACSLASISRSTLYRLIKSGRIRVVRIGRAVRIPLSELEHFVSDLMEARHED